MSNKRHIRYINHAIQNRLIYSMVFFEFVLIFLSVLFLYFDLNEMIEASIYRIHFKEVPNIEFLLSRIFQITCVLLAINLVVVFILFRWWQSYVNSIIDPLKEGLVLLGNLDFSESFEFSDRHMVLENFNKYYRGERENFIKLRGLVNQLDSSDTGQSMQSSYDILKKISDLLSER